MLDWKILNIEETMNKAQVYEALKNILHKAQFKDDLEYIFKCIEAYKNIAGYIDRNDENKIITYEWENIKILHRNNVDVENLNFIEDDSPITLIEKFTEIYSNRKLRFNFYAWKSVLESLFINEINISEYQMPIINFIAENPYLKSDVLDELSKRFELYDFLASDQWHEMMPEDSKYAFATSILSGGQFNLDLFVETIPADNYSINHIDFFYYRLQQSLYFVRSQKYIEAYNVLADIKMDGAPVALIQRKLNILYEAIIKENDETVKFKIFPSQIEEALSIHPNDEHLLYLKASYIHKFGDLNNGTEYIIKILRDNPTHYKVFSVLGKQYLKLKEFKAANLIFKKLSSELPLNLELTAYAAKAAKLNMDMRRNNPNVEKNYIYYRDLIHDLLDYNLYSEITELIQKLKKDDSYDALLLFVKYNEAVFYGQDTQNYLEEAIRIATDPDTKLRACQKKLLLLNVDNYEEHSEFIKKCYQDFPEDAIVNYAFGEYLSFIDENYEAAIKCYDKALKLNPQLNVVHFAKGRSADSFGQHEMAIEHLLIYSKYLRYNPYVFKLLANSYLELEKYSESFDCIKWSCSLENRNAVPSSSQLDYIYSLFMLCDKSEDLDFEFMKNIVIPEAMAFFESFNKKPLYENSTNGMDCYYFIARVYNLIHDYKKSLNALQSAIDIANANNVSIIARILKLKDETVQLLKDEENT